MWATLPLWGRLIIGDCREVLATFPDESIDLMVTSPPFLGQRTYTGDERELGHESPAEYLNELLDLIGLMRYVLAPHGSIVIELGDTYSGSGGAGGDIAPGGMREGKHLPYRQSREGRWPAHKSLCAIPAALEVSLAWGLNALTGEPSTAGSWLIRNAGAWVKPNPRPGDESDKYRQAWSLVICATLSPTRYWHARAAQRESRRRGFTHGANSAAMPDVFQFATARATKGHAAAWPEGLVYRMIEAQCPIAVCQECGEPSRYLEQQDAWSDCGHDSWRRGVVLDPFAGSGTTLAVAVGTGRNAIGIDIDPGNEERALARVGPLLLSVERG